LALTAGVPAPASAAPRFADGFGVTVDSVSVLDSRHLDLTVHSAAVGGAHDVQILLPSDYDSRPDTRYPVLYLLHGALNNAASWVGQGGAETTTATAPLITVIPDGGAKGWYSNWLYPRWNAPQDWETFHLDELVPFVDANLRTIAARDGRAVVGASMGGYGALHYAIDRPGDFAYAASFSGALDLDDPVVRGAITVEESGVLPGSGPPALPDAIFGSPLGGAGTAWQADDPVADAAALRGTGVALYTGGGALLRNPGLWFLENVVQADTHRMDAALTAAGVPHLLVDYGDGRGFGAPGSCDGNHDYGCWRDDLIDVLPHVLAALTHP
jgi:S-formylglutathione hydrolase FrmB